MPLCNNDFVIDGDFNSHHILWDLRSDACGSRLCGWICTHGIAVQNNGSYAFFRGNSKSVIYLTLTAAQTHLTGWRVIDGGTNSDHFLILFEIPVVSRMVEFPNKRFVDQARCQLLLSDIIKVVGTREPAERAATLISLFSTAVKQASFEININSHSTNSPWQDKQSSRDYRKRKAALKQLTYNCNPSN